METGSEKSTSNSDEFFAGLKILVVDDSVPCLMFIAKTLQEFRYNITTCNSAENALVLLHEKKASFDIVLCDVDMPEKDGFQFLQEIGPVLDFPVVMMSSDFDTDAVMRGIMHGVRAFLIKPIRIEELRNLWQYSLRKKDKIDQNFQISDRKQTRKRKQKKTGEDETDTVKELSKKPRIKWSTDLEEKFLQVIIQIGLYAGPKEILKLMKVDNLNFRNIASHLQKFKNCVKRYMKDGQTGRIHPQVLKYFSSQMRNHCALESSNFFSNHPFNSFQSTAATDTQPASSCFDMVPISEVQPLQSLPANLNDPLVTVNNYSSSDSVYPSMLEDSNGRTFDNYDNIPGSIEVPQREVENVNFGSVWNNLSNDELMNNIDSSSGSAHSSLLDGLPSNQSIITNLGSFQSSGIETNACATGGNDNAHDFANRQQQEVDSLKNMSNYDNLLLELDASGSLLSFYANPYQGSSDHYF